MMMHEVYTPAAMAASLGDMGVDVITSASMEKMVMEKRKELYQLRESQTMRKLKKDEDKMRLKDSQTIKVGILMIPDRTGEQQIHQQSQWWEEEMRRREQLQAEQAERDAQYEAELKELQQTEEKLEGLKNQLQAKMDEIRLEEGELTTITKEFEDKVKLELQARMEQTASSSSSSSTPAPSGTTRMQEEAARRAAKKALREGAGNPEQEARSRLFVDIECKSELERQIVRVQKDVGLMKQRIRLKERSREQIMELERKRRIESEPRELPTLEVLYAPKVIPPRPVVQKSHLSRMEEAKRLREEQRAARMASSSSSSSSSKTTQPGVAKN